MRKLIAALLLMAGPALAQSLPSPQIATPSDGDNSKKAVNSEWVTRALGNVTQGPPGPPGASVTIPVAPLIASDDGKNLRVAAPTDITAILGYTPPNPANALSEYDPNAVATNLGLGSLSQLGTPAAGDFVASDGSNLSTYSIGAGLSRAGGPLAVQWGTSSTTSARGDDSRITGAETASHASATWAPVASPALSGTPTAPTPAPTTNTTQIATTAYVQSQGYSTVGGEHPLGGWNASTNTPTLTSGTAPTGGVGGYYQVTVAGSTTLDGNTPWAIGDKAEFVTGSVWKKLPGIAGVSPATTAAVGTVAVPNTGLVVDTPGNLQLNNQIFYTALQEAFHRAPTLPSSLIFVWNNNGQITKNPLYTSGATDATQIYLFGLLGGLPTVGTGAAGTLYWLSGVLAIVPGTYSIPTSAATGQDLGTAMLYAPRDVATAAPLRVNGGFFELNPNGAAGGTIGATGPQGPPGVSGGAAAVASALPTTSPTGQFYVSSATPGQPATIAANVAGGPEAYDLGLKAIADSGIGYVLGGSSSGSRVVTTNLAANPADNTCAVWVSGVLTSAPCTNGTSATYSGTVTADAVAYKHQYVTPSLVGMVGATDGAPTTALTAAYAMPSGISTLILVKLAGTNIPLKLPAIVAAGQAYSIVILNTTGAYTGQVQDSTGTINVGAAIGNKGNMNVVAAGSPLAWIALD